MKFLLKKIYEFIPFKKYIFLIVKKIYSPPEFIYKHLYFKSIFKVIINKNTNFKIKHYGFFLENEIFWKGIFNSYEKNSLIIWAKLSETSNSIFDIGANTGIYSLLSKSINPNSKVYAFEPINRIFDKLEINNSGKLSLDGRSASLIVDEVDVNGSITKIFIEIFWIL